VITKIKNRKGSFLCVVIAIVSIIVMILVVQNNIETEKSIVVPMIALILNSLSLILNGINLFRA